MLTAMSMAVGASLSGALPGAKSLMTVMSLRTMPYESDGPRKCTIQNPGAGSGSDVPLHRPEQYSAFAARFLSSAVTSQRGNGSPNLRQAAQLRKTTAGHLFA